MPSYFTVTPIKDGVGTEVTGDLTKDLSAARKQEIRRLFAKHFLLVFRGQHGLTEERQDELMSCLGPLQKHSGKYDADFIDNVPADRDERPIDLDTGGHDFATDPLPWHNDGEFLPEPFTAAALYALDVVDDASSTEFANGARAYRTLPEALTARIEGLDALHVFATDYTRRNRAADVPPDYPRWPSPLADSDESGTRFLSIAELFIDSIVGLPEAESEALIKELLTHLHAPENVYRHSWRKGDLVIRNNRVVQHRRPASVANVGRRFLRRSSVGEKSLTHQFAEHERSRSASPA